MTMRVGAELDPEIRPWTLEVAPGQLNREIRLFESRNRSVLAMSAEYRAAAASLFSFPITTAGGTIAQVSPAVDSIIGLFPYDSSGDDLDRNLIITASGNMTPAFNDAIKLKHNGGIDIWGDTEFFNTVTAAQLVGPLTGDVTGNLTGNVTGNLTGNVTGNVTGDVTGDLTGDVTGDVTGNLTGNVTGNLTGNVTGNVTGDLTGTVTGDLWGSVFADDGTGPVLTSPNTFANGAVELASNGSGTMTVTSGGAFALTTNGSNAITADTSQDVVIGNNLTSMGDLDVAHGTSSSAVLDIAPGRAVDGACYLRMFSEAVGVQGFRIEKLSGANSELNIMQVANDGEMSLRTNNAAFRIYTNSSERFSISSSGEHTFGPLNSTYFKIDPGTASTVAYEGYIKCKDTGVHITTNWSGRGISLGGNNSEDFHVHKTADGGNSQAKALYVTDVGTDPTAYSPAPSTAYNILNRQNTICASGKFTVIAATSVTTSSNHFGIDETTTNASGYVSAGQFYVYLDRKVEPDATILVSTNAQLSWTAAALSSCGAHLDSSAGAWQYQRILVTVGAYLSASGNVVGLDSDFSLAVIGLMDDDP